MVESTTKDWSKELLNDDNFEQKKAFNYDLCVELFEECGKDLDNINIYLLVRPIWEITKAFEALSSALSVGFSDITSKVQVWRDNCKKYYPEAKTIQEVMDKEISLKIHELNGENNSKLGHKKKTPYHDYTSSTRTLLRLSWFLDFFNNICINCLTNEKKSFAECISLAYDTVLAPHHPWLVRKGASIGISFAPSKRDKAMKAFFGVEKYDEEYKAKMERWRAAIEKVWKAVHQIYVSKNLLELP
jgi:hypothetical protein